MFAIKQIEPRDENLIEEWIREIEDPRTLGIHGVNVTKWRKPQPWRWLVAVYAMEHVCDVPLERTLRREIMRALAKVTDVIGVKEADREQWSVNGAPHGQALVAAVATVIDNRAEQIRAHIDRL